MLRHDNGSSDARQGITRRGSQGGNGVDIGQKGYRGYPFLSEHNGAFRAREARRGLDIDAQVL